MQSVPLHCIELISNIHPNVNLNKKNNDVITVVWKICHSSALKFGDFPLIIFHFVLTITSYFKLKYWHVHVADIFSYMTVGKGNRYLKYMYNTVFHSFQHIINYYQKHEQHTL